MKHTHTHRDDNIKCLQMTQSCDALKCMSRMQ